MNAVVRFAWCTVAGTASLVAAYRIGYGEGGWWKLVAAILFAQAIVLATRGALALRQVRELPVDD
jgi:hypothetical protein